MAKYMLRDLLKVRALRVDAALRHVVTCRQHLARCQQQLLDNQNQLQAFIEYRTREEESLYAKVMGLCIKLADLEELKSLVRALRIEQVAYEQRVFDAQHAIAEAQQALVLAQDRHRLTVRSEEKLKQHHELWQQSDKRTQIMQEDLELEDIAARRVLVG